MAFALFLLGCLMMCAVMFEWVDFMHPVRVWVLLTGSRLRSRIRRIVRFRTLPAMPAAYHLARREQDWPSTRVKRDLARHQMPLLRLS